MSFVDARDAADAFVNALTRGELYGRHLMGVNMSMADFFDRLERLTGVSAPRLHLPSQVNVIGAKLLERWAKFRGTKPTLDPQEVDIGEHYFYLDASKAERELGFQREGSARDAARHGAVHLHEDAAAGPAGHQGPAGGQARGDVRRSYRTGSAWKAMSCS